MAHCVFKHNPGCTPCQEGCLVDLTVTVRCRTSASTTTNINAATVTVKLGGVTVDSCTTDSSGVCTIFDLSSPNTYTVEVSKTGYETITQNVTWTAGDCVDRSTTIEICRDPVILYVFSQSCQAGSIGDSPDGVIDVEITGDATASQSQAVDFTGSEPIPLTVTTPGDCALSLNVEYITPAGYGSQESYSYSGMLYPCSAIGDEIIETSVPSNPGLAIPPKAGHTGYPAGCCGFRNLVDTMEYSDDYGSCTLNRGTTTPSLGGLTTNFAGSYTYSETDAGLNVMCGPTNTCTRGHTGDVTVWIVLAKTGNTVGVRRWMRVSNTLTNACALPQAQRQVLDIAVANCTLTWTLASSGDITGCPLASNAINWSIPFSGTLPSTSGTASITGTIA